MKNMGERSTIASTVGRVPRHTSEDVNRRIRRATAANVAYYQGRRGEIPDRLGELDREWDVERAIEANAAALALAGVLLSVVKDSRWIVLPAVVSGFLLQHALQGWCPPVPILRRLGFRTSHEIETERRELMSLEGTDTRGQVR